MLIPLVSQLCLLCPVALRATGSRALVMAVGMFVEVNPWLSGWLCCV